MLSFFLSLLVLLWLQHISDIRIFLEDVQYVQVFSFISVSTTRSQRIVKVVVVVVVVVLLLLLPMLLLLRKMSDILILSTHG